MKLLLKLVAPYMAVGVFWCLLPNAWLAILAYHAQIVLWADRSAFLVHRPRNKSLALLALLSVIAGPAMVVLLPHITHTDLGGWLTHHHLTGWSLVLMIPYFGVVHPFLEQVHWTPLRKQTPAAHFIFAGYHVLVLYSLLTAPWLVLCLVILTAASFLWQEIQKRSGSMVIPIASHALADLGIVIAAWIRT